MIAYLRWLFSPKPWAVQVVIEVSGDTIKCRWIKVISRIKPDRQEFPGRIWIKFGIQGPFRSEVDCDEFINQAMGIGHPEHTEQDFE